MSDKADIKADILAVDRGESTSLMEPMLITESSRFRGGLTDLALELAQKSAGFRRSLPESLLTSLADLVRSMNCYYSNLIEGHDTHPVDIERALKNDYSKDTRKRDLQLEAKAHIAVQKWIDGGGLSGRAVSSEGIREIHSRFCNELPEGACSRGARETSHQGRGCRGPCGDQSRRGATVSWSFRTGLWRGEQDGVHRRSGGGASPACLDSPVHGWKRKGRAADVACHAA
jgi:hypothetical protein